MPEGRVHPYQKLRSNESEIYTKIHANTYHRVLGPQVTQEAIDKQFTKKSCEWSTIMNNKYQKAETNNPKEAPKQRYGYDSVDDLQVRMSEGNLKSKIKKEVFNFYGIDPPPTGYQI